MKEKRSLESERYNGQNDTAEQLGAIAESQQTYSNEYYISAFETLIKFLKPNPDQKKS